MALRDRRLLAAAVMVAALAACGQTTVERGREVADADEAEAFSAAEWRYLELVRTSSRRADGRSNDELLGVGYELCGAAANGDLDEMFAAFETHPDPDASAELFLLASFALNNLCPDVG